MFYFEISFQGGSVEMICASGWIWEGVSSPEEGHEPDPCDEVYAKGLRHEGILILICPVV